MFRIPFRASLCISVKLKNLKANHNSNKAKDKLNAVVYIRKVKKSESKSQHCRLDSGVKQVVYIRKVKKSESKSQPKGIYGETADGCVYP